MLILSKLDYWNSLFSRHVSDQLKSLHWLKVCERIVYKIACLVYNCMHGLALQYLIDLWPSNTSKQTLRSSKSSASMCLPRICRTLQAHQSSFQSIGPRIWASLPETVQRSGSINEFRSKLKTHLFTISHYK